MIPLARASWEFGEFLAACEDDLGCSVDTVAFYRKKIKPLLKWLEREHREELNALALRDFFRYLKRERAQSEHTRHMHYRAIRTWT